MMAAYRIIVNEEYIEELRERDKQDPNLPENHVSAKLSELVISYVTKESDFVKAILKEIPKAEIEKALKDIIIEYAKTGEMSKDMVKKSRKKIRSTAE